MTVLRVAVLGDTFVEDARDTEPGDEVGAAMGALRSMPMKHERATVTVPRGDTALRVP